MSLTPHASTWNVPTPTRNLTLSFMSLTPSDDTSPNTQPPLALPPSPLFSLSGQAADLRNAKLRLANDIENLLDAFTKLTDLSVSEIYVEQVNSYVNISQPVFNRHIVRLRISL